MFTNFVIKAPPRNTITTQTNYLLFLLKLARVMQAEVSLEIFLAEMKRWFQGLRTLAVIPEDSGSISSIGVHNCW